MQAPTHICWLFAKQARNSLAAVSRFGHSPNIRKSESCKLKATWRYLFALGHSPYIQKISIYA